MGQNIMWYEGDHHSDCGCGYKTKKGPSGVAIGALATAIPAAVVAGADWIADRRRRRGHDDDERDGRHGRDEETDRLRAEVAELRAEKYTDCKVSHLMEEQCERERDSRHCRDRDLEKHASDQRFVFEQLCELKAKAAADAVEDRCQNERICKIEREVEEIERRECSLEKKVAVTDQLVIDKFAADEEEVRELRARFNRVAFEGIKSSAIQHECEPEKLVRHHEHFAPVRTPEMQVDARLCRCDGDRRDDRRGGGLEDRIEELQILLKSLGIAIPNPVTT